MKLNFSPKNHRDSQVVYIYDRPFHDDGIRQTRGTAYIVCHHG